MAMAVRFTSPQGTHKLICASNRRYYVISVEIDASVAAVETSAAVIKRTNSLDTARADARKCAWRPTGRMVYAYGAIFDSARKEYVA